MVSCHGGASEIHCCRLSYIRQPRWSSEHGTWCDGLGKWQHPEKSSRSFLCVPQCLRPMTPFTSNSGGVVCVCVLCVVYVVCGGCPLSQHTQTHSDTHQTQHQRNITRRQRERDRERESKEEEKRGEEMKRETRDERKDDVKKPPG